MTVYGKQQGQVNFATATPTTIRIPAVVVNWNQVYNRAKTGVVGANTNSNTTTGGYSVTETIDFEEQLSASDVPLKELYTHLLNGTSSDFTHYEPANDSGAAVLITQDMFVQSLNNFFQMNAAGGAAKRVTATLVAGSASTTGTTVGDATDPASTPIDTSEGVLKFTLPSVLTDISSSVVSISNANITRASSPYHTGGSKAPAGVTVGLVQASFSLEVLQENSGGTSVSDKLAALVGGAAKAIELYNYTTAATSLKWAGNVKVVEIQNVLNKDANSSDPSTITFLCEFVSNPVCTVVT